MNEVYVVSAVRTAIGTFGGSLKDIPPADLASRVTAEAVRRASVAPADVGHVVFGQVVQTEPRDMYISRVAAVLRAEPSIREIDLNPVIIYPQGEGAIALDALVVVG